MRRLFLFIMLASMLSSCATYYQKNQKFQEMVQKGEIDKAKKFINRDSVKASEGKDRVLHFFNMGWLDYMSKEYQPSTQWFEKADLYIEDYQKSLGAEALALITNPMVKPYKPEDVENVMTNYYKAVDYLLMKNLSGSLVEARKITQKLYALNDKYKDHKNRYSDDAFAHVLIGLVYDADNDYNNAFIAYRNALKVYEEIYTPNFGLEAPEQLKHDILRTAYLTGFQDQVDFYERKFNMKYHHKKEEGGTLIVLWENGFGPVKSEWSINFSVMKGSGGMVTFANDDLGLSFPFFIGDWSSSKQSEFSDLSFLRVAFPKYLTRPPVFHAAELKVNNAAYPLELAENLNEISFKTLQDRMLRELGNSLLRLASKKLVESAVRSQDKNIGAAVGILNALTEKADTRNWQTLPYSISYARVSLPEGTHKVELKTSGKTMSSTHEMNVDIIKGRTVFKTFRSLETFPAQENL